MSENRLRIIISANADKAKGVVRDFYRDMAQADRGVKNLHRTMHDLNGTSNMLTGTIARLGGALAAYLSLRQAIQMAYQYNRTIVFRSLPAPASLKPIITNLLRSIGKQAVGDLPWRVHRLTADKGDKILEIDSQGLLGSGREPTPGTGFPWPTGAHRLVRASGATPIRKNGKTS